MAKVTGGCHCKKVRFEAEAVFDKVIECNCSHCAIKGLILVFIPAADFKLLSGEENLVDYQFNKHVIHHLFCKACGVQSFARGKGHDGSETVALNLRALDDFDVKSVTVTPFDGKSL